MSKAQGSAYIEQGQTKAICAVYGPREIPRKSDFTMKGILNCTIERTPFSGSKRKAPGSRGDLEEDEMSKLLSEALEATVCMVSFFMKVFFRKIIIFITAAPHQHLSALKSEKIQKKN